MQLPLSFWDFRLWLAINAVILLITSEVLLSYHEKMFMIEKKRLRTIALILGIIFAITVLIQIYETLIVLQP